MVQLHHPTRQHACVMSWQPIGRSTTTEQARRGYLYTVKFDHHKLFPQSEHLQPKVIEFIGRLALAMQKLHMNLNCHF